MVHATTMKEIARQLGVTVSTVSRALQNHPSIGLRTRERVHELAKQLDYVPNPTAINLKRRRTYNIGVVLPALTEQFFSMAISAIEDVAIGKGYSVVVMQSRNDYERERLAISNLVKHGIDGIIVSLASETQNNSHFLEVNKHGIPIVFFDRVAKNMPNSCVYVDLTAGAIEAVEYLVARGLTKIALLNGPGTLQATDERLKGYVTVLNKHGIAISRPYVRSVNLTKEDTAKKMNELLDLDEPPQAILAFNDYVALDAMQVCRQRGLVINQDIHFVSFSNLPFCSYLEQPPIASIEQFPYEMGTKAIQLLLPAIEDPQHYTPEKVIIPYQLIVRE
ncbi:LacI family DNA-binding transcriptional regulator [Larkinella humicola]|uniref:LacI family transcriptional regulator n=1 Tax=Larkinella humicola TaxID=2607654 RepID=A0A5N1JBV2_9BACT|nr:LacI family DNA-binding transcriptional regulator [Larkinella humicola]KAA9349838.1 LacI family transcriptional regulator [Larkinella humicola]